VSYSEGGLFKSNELFCNWEYPDDELLTEPVDDVLLLGIPVDRAGKSDFDVLILI